MKRAWKWFVELDGVEQLLLVLLIVLGLPLFALCAGFLWGLIAMWVGLIEPPPAYSLPKTEWRCTASHVEHGTIFVQVGKVMVPTPTTDIVCDEYRRAR